MRMEEERIQEADVFYGNTNCTIVLSQDNDGYTGTVYYQVEKGKSDFQMSDKRCYDESRQLVIEQCEQWIRGTLGDITSKEDFHDMEHYWDDPVFHERLENPKAISEQDLLLGSYLLRKRRGR